MNSWPLVNLQNAVVVASQTHIDGSPTDLGRPPCRVQIHSGPRTHHSKAISSHHSWPSWPSQKVSSTRECVGDVALTITDSGHAFSRPLWYRHLNWKPSSMVMSRWWWCRTCENHSFTVDFGLFYGFVYQCGEPFICQKHGTPGSFEILQTLSGTFVIRDKYQICPRFWKKWTLCPTFHSN